MSILFYRGYHRALSKRSQAKRSFDFIMVKYYEKVMRYCEYRMARRNVA